MSIIGLHRGRCGNRRSARRVRCRGRRGEWRAVLKDISSQIILGWVARIKHTGLGGGILIRMRRQGVCRIDVGHARPRDQYMCSNKQLSPGKDVHESPEKVSDVVLLGLWGCGEARNV